MAEKRPEPGTELGDVDDSVERRRSSPSARSATTIANTITEPTSMIHQSDEIVPAELLCGASVDCPPPQPVRQIGRAISASHFVRVVIAYEMYRSTNIFERATSLRPR